MHQPSLDPAADRARKMRQRRGPVAAGQDEFLERGKLSVEFFDLLFQMQDMHFLNRAVTRQADFAAEIEQFVLDDGQHLAHGGWQLLGQQDAEAGVEFVDFADAVDTQAILADPFAVGQSGHAGIAGAGDYF